MRKSLIGMLLAVGLVSCAQIPEPQTNDLCSTAAPIGEFNPQTDVFVGHFDSKPDVDDLHTIAAVGSLLKQPEFECVNAIGVAGAYGTQGGEYIEAPALMQLAFGDDWLDGHNQRPDTVARQAKLFVDTIDAGGHVWIMIAGQGDIAADALVAAKARAPDLPYSTHLHLVQHSDWNESVTAAEKLAFVQSQTDYRKIADGNARGNGTPGYTSDDGTRWTDVLADPIVGLMWQEAKRLADLHNPTAAYVNPSVVAGGFDFSDTSEMSHVFGMNALDDVEMFFDFVLAGSNIEWPNGARAAIALTYDDALQSQLDHAVPQLDAAGLKATFYLSMAMQDFQAQRDAWQAVAAAGHELGNHTIAHPCRASLPGRDWLTPNRDLDAYSKDQLLTEIAEANEILSSIDGKSRRSFAYTCGDTQVGGDSFIDDLAPLVSGARSVQPKTGFDPFFIASLSVNQAPASEMIAYVDQLIATRALGTITFHGIEGDHLWVTAADHQALLDYLVRKEDEIWVAPLDDILAHIESVQTQ
ncbi:MAG: polysaccharide deacetylase family protein [Pseudomonadota bacterium]